MGANDIDKLLLVLPGDVIRRDDLLPAAEALIEMSQSLWPAIRKTESAMEHAALMKASSDLLALARDLIENDIALAAGEARISAEQVREAVVEAQKAIDTVQRAKPKLRKIGAVLGFVEAVMSGRGTKIIDRAFALKDRLSAP
jgi:hypothetical protein